MPEIVVDDATRDQLLAGPSVVVIRDQAGNVIGEYQPVSQTRYYVIDRPWPTAEELERRLKEDKRYTPEQVMERLRSLRDAG